MTKPADRAIMKATASSAALCSVLARIIVRMLLDESRDLHSR